MKLKLLLTAILFTNMSMFAQVGIGTTTPNAALDVTSTTDGLLIPRVALTITTSALPLTTPTTSELVYNTATVADVTPGYYYWNGTSWTRLGVGSADWSLTGNAGTNAATNFLGTTDAQDLVFKTNGTERFRNFNATGNTYFGSTTDTNNAKLSVTSTNTTSGIFATLNGTTGATSQGLSVTNNTPTAVGVNKRGILNFVSDTGTPNLRIGIENQMTTNANAGLNNYFLYNNYFPSTTVTNSTIFVLNSLAGNTMDINTVLTGTRNSFSMGVASTGLIYGTQNDIRTTSADKVGTYNTFTSNNTATGGGVGLKSVGKLTFHTGTGNHDVYGSINSLTTSGTGTHYGVFTTSDIVLPGAAPSAGPASNAIFYGTYNDLKNTGSGAHYGTFTNLTGTGTGSKYGDYITIPTTAGGSNYGIYADATDTTNDFSGYFLGRVSIGTTAANNYILPTSRGTNGQIMTTNGSGVVSWTNAPAAAWSLVGNAGTVAGTNFIGTTDNVNFMVRTNNVDRFRFTTKGQLETLNNGSSVYLGEFAGAAISTGVNNVAVGHNALKAHTTGSRNVAIGKDALLSSVSGNNNVAVGYDAMSMLTGTVGNAMGNVAVGNFAMNSSNGGQYNVAVGLAALQSINSGTKNVSLGFNSGAGIYSGNHNFAVGEYTFGQGDAQDNNVAIGFEALYNCSTSNNIGIGFNALHENFGGTDNIVFGKSSGFSNQTGSNNLFFGSQSGLTNDGSNNVFMGTDTGLNNTTGSNNIYIGHQAGMAEIGTNNRLYIENSSATTPLIGGDFTTDKVIINGDISNATHTLTVEGNAKIADFMNLKPKAAAPAVPAEGDVYYDATLKKIRVWTGAAWENLN